MPVFVLEGMPWGFSYPGIQYWRDKQVNVWKGSVLPDALRPYRTADFSFERWREDEINGTVSPTKRGNTVFTPRPHQKEGAKAIYDAYQNGHSGALNADATGLGKGLASSAKIPTPNGFITMGELKEGDLVYGANGVPTKVIEKYTSKATKFYRITFSDGSTIDADEDHRWLTSSQKERMRVFNKTKTRKRISEQAELGLREHLLESQDRKEAVTLTSCFLAANSENKYFIRELLINAGSIGRLSEPGSTKIYHPQEVLETLEKTSPTIGNRWSASGVMPTESVKTTHDLFETQHRMSGSTLRRNHSIKNAKAIRGKKRELPIDPYVLGAWLGDGDSYHCGITSMDFPIIERISQHYPIQRIFGEDRSGKAKSYSFVGLYTDIHKLFNTPKGKIKKRVPLEYLTASIEQRIELLKGLLDTDGSISKSKSQGVTFSEKDPILFFQVYSLVCSLGWKATWRSKQVSFYKNGDKNTYYELMFYPDKQVFSLPRKQEILEEHISSFGSNKKFNNRYIVSVKEIDKTEDYYCISVDSPDHLYLCTESYIPTHNTLSSLAGVTAIARAEKKNGKYKNERATLLIACPKGVMPVWRQTIQNFPAATEFLRPLIMSYHQLNKLLQAPAQARTAKKKRTKNRATARQGKPTVDWDYIIWDESHYLKNFPSSTMSVSAVNIAQHNKPYSKGRSPFVVYSTATPGSSPLNFAVMSQMMAPLIAANKGKKLDKAITPDQWGQFLFDNGFDVKEGKVKGNWTWAPAPWFGKNSDDPAERAKYEAGQNKAKANQRKDAIAIGKALKRADAPFIMRRPQDLADWPEQQLIPLPAELTQKQLPIYEEAWNRFRQFLNLKPKGVDPKGGLAEALRYRQKSSLLRVESMIDNIVDSVNNGNQVFISCEFSESIDKYKEALTKKKISVAEISGRNVKDRENERIRFQKGEAQVVLCSVVAGISLHAEETLPDGSKATKTPRITFVHDIRQNPLDTVQLLGRCHRDGQNSLAYFPYFTDTVDERVVESFTNKQVNMKLMTGSDKDSAEEVEDIFRQAAAKS